LALPILALLVAAWGVVVAFLRYYRVWLLYYVIATVGLVYFLIIILGGHLGVEPYLAHSVAYAVHKVAALFNIPTRIFENAPGALLVLVVVQSVGWTVLQIGVESSGLLEISVLVSLLCFYPLWSIHRRAGFILVGGMAIWIANILRMLLIVVLLHLVGKEALFFAHTIVGRVVFFFLTIVIFWYLFTNATIRVIQSKRWSGRRADTIRWNI